LCKSVVVVSLILSRPADVIVVVAVVVGGGGGNCIEWLSRESFKFQLV
jgi:hypothetical protein